MWITSEDNDEPRHTRNELRFAITESSLGLVLVARGNAGICAVLIGDDRDTLREDLKARMSPAVPIEEPAEASPLLAEVVRLVEHPARDFSAPIEMRGSAFQREVWRALCEIPPGVTATYTDIANRIGRPNAVRAVAQACGANSLAVIVPCHRVVGRDGQLSGYRWGIERKRALLAREAAGNDHAPC